MKTGLVKELLLPRSLGAELQSHQATASHTRTAPNAVRCMCADDTGRRHYQPAHISRPFRGTASLPPCPSFKFCYEISSGAAKAHTLPCSFLRRNRNPSCSLVTLVVKVILMHLDNFLLGSTLLARSNYAPRLLLIRRARFS
jgi:hypothetical protein